MAVGTPQTATGRRLFAPNHIIGNLPQVRRDDCLVLPLEDLGVTPEGDLEVSHYAPPPKREKGIMVEDAAQLVQELKNRGLL